MIYERKSVSFQFSAQARQGRGNPVFYGKNDAKNLVIGDHKVPQAGLFLAQG